MTKAYTAQMVYGTPRCNGECPLREWVDRLAAIPKNDDYDLPDDGYERSFLDDLLNLSPKLKSMTPEEVSDTIHVIAPKIAALIYVLDGNLKTAEAACEAALLALGRKWNGTGCGCPKCEAARAAIDKWCKGRGR